MSIGSNMYLLELTRYFLVIVKITTVFEQPIILYISKPRYLLTSFLGLPNVYDYYLYCIHTNFSLRVYFQYIL